jgi:hypothetical protein
MMGVPAPADLTHPSPQITDLRKSLEPYCTAADVGAHFCDWAESTWKIGAHLGVSAVG